MNTKELYFKNYGGEITCGELEENELAEIRNLYISGEFEDSDYFCSPYNWSSICGVYGIFTNLKGGEIQYDKVTPAYNKRYDYSIKKDGIYLLSKSLGKVFTSIELELEDEEEFDELEYTGPNEGEVYDRFEKVQKTFKSYVNANNKHGYLDNKTIKARQKFSECISELRLAPKLVSTMMEIVSHRVDEVKK